MCVCLFAIEPISSIHEATWDSEHKTNQIYLNINVQVKEMNTTRIEHVDVTRILHVRFVVDHRNSTKQKKNSSIVIVVKLFCICHHCLLTFQFLCPIHIRWPPIGTYVISIHKYIRSIRKQTQAIFDGGDDQWRFSFGVVCVWNAKSCQWQQPTPRLVDWLNHHTFKCSITCVSIGAKPSKYTISCSRANSANSDHHHQKTKPKKIKNK